MEGDEICSLEASALIVEPESLLALIQDDPDDDLVLECAPAGKADYVVSGDRHLLKLGSYGGIRIMTIRQLIEAFEIESMGRWPTDEDESEGELPATTTACCR